MAGEHMDRKTDTRRATGATAAAREIIGRLMLIAGVACALSQRNCTALFLGRLS